MNFTILSLAIRANHNTSSFERRFPMLRYALGFFVFALIAAFLGFSGMAFAAAGIAKILFFIFLVLFVCTMVGHLLRRA